MDTLLLITNLSFTELKKNPNKIYESKNPYKNFWLPNERI